MRRLQTRWRRRRDPNPPNGELVVGVWYTYPGGCPIETQLCYRDAWRWKLARIGTKKPREVRPPVLWAPLPIKEDDDA